jgi:hypothetical protein
MECPKFTNDSFYYGSSCYGKSHTTGRSLASAETAFLNKSTKAEPNNPFFDEQKVRQTRQYFISKLGYT